MNIRTRSKPTKYLVWLGWLTKSAGRISPLCHAFLLLLQYRLLPSKVGRHGCHFISKASSSFLSLSLLLLLQSPYFQVGVLKHVPFRSTCFSSTCSSSTYSSSLSLYHLGFLDVRPIWWSMVPFLFARKTISSASVRLRARVRNDGIH